ncbi:hypothetical protein EDD11_006154 [Mortierella claussenii]|nr:hypothetical protein EDD11_006154 [Mortierella claussenii]
MLRDIPLQIFRLPSLRELDVSQNLLTEISGLIGRLAPTLEELFLQSNRLESLPQQLGHLKKLRLLDIADNQLGCIPVEVQRLVSESSSTAASARVHYHRRMSHPEHLVDRRGYSKDSYTSCSWAMSLADICAQIVGEKLFEDPHYFCHSSSCPHKTKSKMSQRFKREKMYADASFVDRQGNHGQEYNKTWKDERVEQMEECTIMMMPDWMIEQLGLEHLSEIQQPFFPDSSSSDPLSTERTSDNDDELFTGNNAITVSEASARTHQTRSDLLTRLPAPMELTLQEKEMGSEFCSVCQKRLYFAGMRWKGVGVMDERIVPLEWVACSVQCRARAEHGDRRDDINSYNEKRSHGSHQDYQSRHHAIDRNHDSNAGYGSGRTFSSAAEPPSSSSSTLSTLPGASGSVGSSRAFRSTSLSVTSSASSSISSGRGRHLEGGIQNGNSTRVNHDGQLQNQSQDQGQGQLFSSPLQSPSLSPALTAPSLSDAGGTGRVRVGTEGNGVGHGSPAANATTTSSVPVVHHRHRPPQEQQHQHQHQQLQVQQRHHQRYHQQDQRIYRETDLYGLIKSRALRRRARTLSL